MKPCIIRGFSGAVFAGRRLHRALPRDPQWSCRNVSDGAAGTVSDLVVSGDPFQQFQALRDDSGLWMVSLNRVSEFKYFYLVDGKTYLPDCRLRENDDFR